MEIIRRTIDHSQNRFDANVEPLLQRIYLARGVCDAESLERRLTCLPDPAGLRGIAAAVDLLKSLLKSGRKIIVVGDFDADGATSSALMLLALRAMGFSSLDYLVPNRFEYGYGLTPEIVELAAERNPDLLVTVDNGISSIEGVARANELGIQVIVTDHHLPGQQLPQAAAIVNPNQPGCDFPGKNLAGVGVAFYLLSALRASLRDSGWFVEQQIAEPFMADWLDLVALGTVADVVPLDQANRALVHQGLLRIRAGKCRPGIEALLRVAGRDQRAVSASDLGFVLGPRLNAAGRLDDMALGIECLLSENPQPAWELARQLDELNRDRRQIERHMQSEALAIVEELIGDQGAELPPVLCLYRPEWHQGVVGLVASRLKEHYHRPVIAFADGDDGNLKGSARSIPALHIRDALAVVSAQNPGLICKFGGHAMAAGLSLKRDNLEKFNNALVCVADQLLSADDLNARMVTDGELATDDLALQTARLLKDAGPWGQRFPEPSFDGEFTVRQQRIVGERHLKLVLSPGSGAAEPLNAIQFNTDTERWPDRSIERVRCVYRLDVNDYRGTESLQLLIDYLEPV